MDTLLSLDIAGRVLDLPQIKMLTLSEEWMWGRLVGQVKGMGRGKGVGTGIGI